MNKPQLILIDLDGTLVDSVPDLAFCANEMLRRLGREPWDEERVRDWVGNGVERFVRRALVGAVEGEPAEDEFDKAYPIFLQLYAEHNGERSQLYPGIQVGLETLSQDAYHLSCVTNKAAEFTEPLLEALGIAHFFEVIISGDTLPRKKPDPLPLLHVAEHFQADPTQSLMVGDSISDVKAARAAGFQVVCVTYGYNHGNDIRDAEPDAVMDSLTELPALFVNR